MYHHLPFSAYTSQEWFDQEQREIFSKTWRYAGFMEDITEPGQYISVEAGLNNIFIVMGRDHRLRAFHNICRHRGTQLLRAVGKAQKAITCPYHDWSYDLEGNCISIPEEEREFENIDKSCLGLMPATVDLWRGMLYVHPDPPEKAPSLAEWFAPCEPYLGPHQVEQLPEYEEARTSYEIKANWKIVVENYIDVYHLAHLHSGTLAMYDHAKAEYGFHGPHYLFKEPLVPEFLEDLEKNTPTPLVIPKEDAAAWVPMLFPGIGLAESESNWATFIITPLAPDLTRVENRVRLANKSSWEFTKQEWRSAAFWKKQIKPKYEQETHSHDDDPMASGDFTQEDIYACEQQQKSLQSPHLKIGPASRGEAPVLEHQKVILKYLGKEIPDLENDLVTEKTNQCSGTPNSPEASVKVTLDGETHKVSVEAGETLITAIRRAGLEPPFACLSGICGKCKATLTAGTCEMKSQAALDDTDLAQQKILTCQALATSAELEVVYP